MPGCDGALRAMLSACDRGSPNRSLLCVLAAEPVRTITLDTPVVDRFLGLGCGWDPVTGTSPRTQRGR